MYTQNLLQKPAIDLVQGMRQFFMAVLFIRSTRNTFFLSLGAWFLSLSFVHMVQGANITLGLWHIICF